MSRNIPVIAQHVSWLSLDPILNCPAECSYCYLHPLGLTKRKPDKYVSPEKLYSLLKDHPQFKKDRFGRDIESFPICIGNYTDMCLTPDNRNYLIEFLKIHRDNYPNIPVCIVTKAKLPNDFLEKINSLNLRVIFIISLSFLPLEYERGTTPINERLLNFEKISHYEHIKSIHYWRPITSISSPNKEVIEDQILSLQRANSNASILVGLNFGNDLRGFWENTTSNPLHRYFKAKLQENPEQKHSIVDSNIQELILDYAKKNKYPAFLNTTCAISFVLGMAEYSGIFRGGFREKLCLPAHCPGHQRERCISIFNDNKEPSPSLITQISKYLNLPLELINYDNRDDVIVIDSKLTDAEERYLSQATGFLVHAKCVEQTLEWSIATNRDKQPLKSRPK